MQIRRPSLAGGGGHEKVTLTLISTFPILKTVKNGMRLENGGRAQNELSVPLLV